MSDLDGLAPEEWQYGGKRGPAPPVVLARKDQVPFSKHDFEMILEQPGQEFRTGEPSTGALKVAWVELRYMSHWEEAREDEDHFTEVTNKILEPKAFQRFVRQHVEGHPLAFLSLQFPKQSKVVADGLKSRPELNGQEGLVSEYSRDRVGIQFPEVQTVTALRPERLRLLQEAPEPAAKRHLGVKQSEERKKDLERQEALQISKRFHECLFEDTFPEMGDLHLFGLGGDYKARATEVLAVWQGLVKNMDFQAEQIADALIQGNMQEKFKDSCPEPKFLRTTNIFKKKEFKGASWV